MAPLALAALVALWLLVWAARPRRPEGMNETAWLVYSRLDGSWQRLTLTAFVITVLALCVMVGVFIQAAPALDPCATHPNATHICN